MRRLFVLIILLFSSCSQRSSEELANWKASATQKSDEKVNEIIRQLQEDCDSSLLQMAHDRADSIRGARKKVKM
jgi:Tfp pilus assembly protein PilP